MEESTKNVTLNPKSPFSFELSAQIFKNGDQQIRKYENGKFSQVIRLDKTLILISLTSGGTVNKPKLSAKLTSKRKITQEQTERAISKIRSLFNMDLDLTPFYDGAKVDPILQDLTEKLRGLKSPTTQTVFESLIDSIIEQQISLKVANSLERKIIKQYGERLKAEEKEYFSYPTPKVLSSVTTDELRQCGLSSNKAEYIRNISNEISKGKLDLETFRDYEDTEKIVQELEAIRGVGVWTAKLTIIRSMHKWDVFPSDDIGLRRILSHYYNRDEKISSSQADEIAKPWGRWKGLAAYYFVVAENMEIET